MHTHEVLSIAITSSKDSEKIWHFQYSLSNHPFLLDLDIFPIPNDSLQTNENMENSIRQEKIHSSYNLANLS